MDWIEGVVTSVLKDRVFITFKEGSTIYRMGQGKRVLSLGDVVDICVRQTKEDCFDIVKMGENSRRRNDLNVEPFEGTKCSVYCTAKVVDRRRDFFVLETPIIGFAICLFKDAPYQMEVGDEWRIKMLRRKEKQRNLSYWMFMKVDGKNPRVSTEMSRRSEEKDRIDYTNTSGYSSRESFPSTPNTSQKDWTTVIITGSNDLSWYGSCAEAEVVCISKNLNRCGKDLERGGFYRVKLSSAFADPHVAGELDPEPVYHRDIQVNAETNVIKLWCYSRIVDVRESSFIVRNNLIGNATLPFKRATKEMRMGDHLETLYYRVRTTNNPTHWMVQEAKLIRSKMNNEDEYGKAEERNERNSIDERRESEGKNTLNERKDDKIPVKDRRVLEKMHHLMRFPEVRKAFLKNPNAFDNINKIIDRAYNTYSVL